MKRAVFLDRDGVICYDVHYMSSPDQFQLMPGVAEGIRKLNEAGFLVIVVTNQSGIMRGYFTEDDLKKVHERMVRELGERGARIDAIYYCPCLPEDDCECRKPKPGMLIQAAHDHGIDLYKSFIIGDKDIDAQAGRAAGCTSLLISDQQCPNADYLVSGFSPAVEKTLNLSR